RDRLQLHPRQQGRRGTGRKSPDRQARDLRGRPSRASRAAEARQARDRLYEGRDVAEDVTPGQKQALPAPTPRPVEGAETVAAPAVAAPSRSEKARKSAFRGRFVAVYFVLAIVVGVAIGGLAVTLSSPKKKATKPTGHIFTSSTSGELGAID